MGKLADDRLVHNKAISQGIYREVNRPVAYGANRGVGKELSGRVAGGIVRE